MLTLLSIRDFAVVSSTELEFGVQLGAFGAVAHHAAVGPQAGQEAQGVDQ